MPAGWQDSWRQPENRIRLAVLATAVLLFILLIAVAIQSWFVDWPGRLWLTLAVGGAVALSLLLARIWRPAPLTIAVLSWAVLLLVSTYLYGSDSGGLGILGLPFDTLIAGLFLLATGLAAGWLIRLTLLPLWAKVLVVTLAAYAWLLWVLYRNAREVRRRVADPLMLGVSTGFIVALASLVALDVTGNRFFFGPTMTFIWIVGGGLGRAARDLPEERPPERPRPNQPIKLASKV